MSDLRGSGYRSDARVALIGPRFRQSVLPALIVGAAVVLLVLGTASLVERCSDQDVSCNATAGAAGGLVAGSIAGALVLAVWTLTGRRGTRRVAWSIAVGSALVAATPVEVVWHDGCNSHQASMAAAAAVVTEIASPTATPFAFIDLASLRECRAPIAA